MLSDEELRALVERELADDIERRLRSASREQIVASLVEDGFVRETARAYVDRAIARAKPPRSWWRTVLTFLCGGAPGTFPNDPGGSGSLHLRG